MDDWKLSGKLPVRGCVLEEGRVGRGLAEQRARKLEWGPRLEQNSEVNYLGASETWHCRGTQLYLPPGGRHLKPFYLLNNFKKVNAVSNC